MGIAYRLALVCDGDTERSSRKLELSPNQCGFITVAKKEADHRVVDDPRIEIIEDDPHAFDARGFEPLVQS